MTEEKDKAPAAGQEKKSRLEMLEDTVSAMALDIEELKKRPVGKVPGLFGGKREKVAIKDTKTGAIYLSKSAAGKALAPEADTTAADHFAWYKLQSKFPDRFIPASEDETAKAQKEEDERIAAALAKAEKEEADRKTKEEAEAKK